MLDEYLIAKTAPKAHAKQIIAMENVRITVLTPELIRVEISDNRRFCDEATQTVWFRELDECDYTVDYNDKEIVIVTESATFHFNRKKEKVDYVVLGGQKTPCNNAQNLKGTARTLDMAAGAVRLGKGIIGKNGVAYFDDKSLILGEDGEVKPREFSRDRYIFACLDYKKSLKAFFKITGFPPMVPRYALGNWWSRYHAYTQDEYLNLMDRFQKENLPFSVATVDMDWHWVNLKKQFDKKFGYMAGWTGYSWNTKLFPDYKAFFEGLKERDLKISLNLHPATGVRYFEDMYPEMCAEMGYNPEEKQTIPFDVTDPKFVNAYFKVLHHPYEKDGVNVWWIDWQQGKKTRLENYDPLWGLNHYHSLSAERDGLRPIILSRYAGFGSHRYPLGFSGDTLITWSALRFQPFFTANAANCGYISWSHDIGGHQLGSQLNNELYLRWLQLGVFSPIVRLHSTKIGRGKEPWNFPQAEEAAGEWLRLRMRLIPYLYTAYYRAYKEGRAVCEPLYYRFPREIWSYRSKREYYFGSELIVAPITTKMNLATKKSSVHVWLPEGRYTDIFTGKVYNGGKMHFMRRPMDTIPVLARDGAIVPLANNVGNDVSNPQSFDVLVFSGKRSFTLYEDDGLTNAYKDGDSVTTEFTVDNTEAGVLRFTIEPANGNLAYIPSSRDYKVCFRDLVSCESAEVTVDGIPHICVEEDNLAYSLTKIASTSKVEITLRGVIYK